MCHWLDRGRHACLCHSLRLCGQRPARTRARCRNRPSRRPEWCGVKKTLNLLAHASQPIAPTSPFENLSCATRNTTFKSICKDTRTESHQQTQANTDTQKSELWADNSGVIDRGINQRSTGLLGCECPQQNGASSRGGRLITQIWLRHTRTPTTRPIQTWY